MAQTQAQPAACARKNAQVARVLLRKFLRYGGMALRGSSAPFRIHAGGRCARRATAVVHPYGAGCGNLDIIKHEGESVHVARVSLAVAGILLLGSGCSSSRTVKAAVKDYKDSKKAPDFALKDANAETFKFQQYQ